MLFADGCSMRSLVCALLLLPAVAQEWVNVDEERPKHGQIYPRANGVRHPLEYYPYIADNILSCKGARQSRFTCIYGSNALEYLIDDLNKPPNVQSVKHKGLLEMTPTERQNLPECDPNKQTNPICRVPATRSPSPECDASYDCETWGPCVTTSEPMTNEEAEALGTLTAEERAKGAATTEKIGAFCHIFEAHAVILESAELMFTTGTGVIKYSVGSLCYGNGGIGMLKDMKKTWEALFASAEKVDLSNGPKDLLKSAQISRVTSDGEIVVVDGKIDFVKLAEHPYIDKTALKTFEKTSERIATTLGRTAMVGKGVLLGTYLYVGKWSYVIGMGFTVANVWAVAGGIGLFALGAGVSALTAKSYNTGWFGYQRCILGAGDGWTLFQESLKRSLANSLKDLSKALDLEEGSAGEYEDILKGLETLERDVQPLMEFEGAWERSGE